MGKPNRDLWLIPLGIAYPIVGYAAMSVVTRNLQPDVSTMFVCISLVPAFGVIGVLLTRALGAPFSSLGVLGFMAWMAIVGFGCVRAFDRALGSV